MHLFKTLLSAFLAVSAIATPISDVSGHILTNEAFTFKSLVGRDDTTLTAATLRTAMKDASGWFAAKFRQYDVIIQGGAVNVLLGDRTSTRDMDYIASEWVQGEGYEGPLKDLKRAMAYAHKMAQERGQPIPNDWADSTIQFHFYNKREVWTKYKTEALKQYYVLEDGQNIDKDAVDSSDDEDYSCYGLTFIAAPFDYQFVVKIANANEGKQYDTADAAKYLNIWLGIQKKDSINYGIIQSWFTPWRQKIPNNLVGLCNQVNSNAGKELITGIPAS
ncbi:hypothetical protein N7474_003976 [Penicillium riverlandense]|uniref:uncharacterized protein n=1 Tax=Penicillium riverlandense TaxID=1903569 RepID=UPI00254772CA|nr:uncharacterized protein N7474_003976 [Penicillium riverlandense]KAJ5818385.1 hypothetical protein N7474_003976 [Penicillium riverlandense]